MKEPIKFFKYDITGGIINKKFKKNDYGLKRQIFNKLKVLDTGPN